MPFAESFRHLVDTGCFELTDSELTFAQLDQINNYVHENPTNLRNSLSTGKLSSACQRFLATSEKV
ncbi:hypothetical protein [Rickettsiella endosymbiont of Miltochrista miniata]|uniref:hypothetical protein n=1 Tax=Rickettsiella endosymbiont of Miltochrista miniata TaxID=3066239 RepID=UPI00313DA701